MTGIQWTEETWNPTVGCSLVSPGCTNCYAMTQAARIVKMNAGTATHYAGTVRRVNDKEVWTGKVAVAPDHIFEKPLHRGKPTLYFVNSMSDLFHEEVPDHVIDRVFAIMEAGEFDYKLDLAPHFIPRHRFQVLTKRPERMLAYTKARQAKKQAYADRFKGCPTAEMRTSPAAIEAQIRVRPFSNIWLGVSVEDQKRADERIPVLLETPAAVRFLSVEPMLGPIGIAEAWPTRDGPKIDWVICGGESGPGARPFNLAWARVLRDQCIAGRIAFFMKQMGSNPVDVALRYPLKHRKGGEMLEWPEDLRVRQMPVAA